MPASSRSSALPYTPSAPPAGEDVIRAVWDEFFLISQGLANQGNPVSLAIRASEPIAVGPTVVYDRLFDQGLSYDWQQPGGTVNPATGIWTCPEEGLYQISNTVKVPPFPTPADKAYTLHVRVTRDPITGGPEIIDTFEDVGTDTHILTLTGFLMIPLFQGDQLALDAGVTHETKTGTDIVEASLFILRVGSRK